MNEMRALIKPHNSSKNLAYLLKEHEDQLTCWYFNAEELKDDICVGRLYQIDNWREKSKVGPGCRFSGRNGGNPRG